jgi:methyl acetate hydrolase
MEEEMQTLQGALDAVIDLGVARGVTGILTDADREIWSGAAGEIRPDTPLRLYSMTKLVGAVGAMVLTERGQLDWASPVGAILPEFDDLPVLDGWTGSKPCLRPQRTRATFADLARHTSGSAYALWQPDLMRYFQETGQPIPESGSPTSWRAPLLFDPGRAWAYGFGLDWLGRAIERVSGQTLPEFFEREVFRPLGLTTLTFAPTDEQRAALPNVWRHMQDDTLAPFSANPPTAPETYGLGNALFGSARDYIALLRCLLRGGEPVLSKRAVDTLFKPATAPLPVMRPVAWPAHTFDLQIPVTHTLAAMCTEADLSGRRKAGSLFWAGFLNTHYWIDRTSNRAGLIATQTVPFADPAFMTHAETFERAAYAQIS